MSSAAPSSPHDASVATPSEPWAEPAAISNLPTPGALAAVARLTVARQLRGQRLLIFMLLFAAPAIVGLLARRYDPHFNADSAARDLIFGLFPQGILPLAALLFASSLVQDDVEEQTLTYLLIRPIPRWAIYAAKMAGAVLATSLLAAIFTAATIAVVRQGSPEYDAAAVLKEAGVVSGLWLLSLSAYMTIFGFLGLLTRRVLVIGVGYILVFEEVASNVPFLVRYGTIFFHVRNLAVHLLGLSSVEWSIDSTQSPGAATSAAVLAGVTAVFLALGAWVFSTREFRVKTPEGN